MEIFFSVIVIILIILKNILFIDIILSWLSIIGIHFRPKFLSDIMEPLYKFIKDKISTTIWPIEFAPVIIYIIIIFFISFLIWMTWENFWKLLQLNNILF